MVATPSAKPRGLADDGRTAAALGRAHRRERLLRRGRVRRTGSPAGPTGAAAPYFAKCPDRAARHRAASLHVLGLPVRDPPALTGTRPPGRPRRSCPFGRPI